MLGEAKNRHKMSRILTGVLRMILFKVVLKAIKNKFIAAKFAQNIACTKIRVVNKINQKHRRL